MSASQERLTRLYAGLNAMPSEAEISQQTLQQLSSGGDVFYANALPSKTNSTSTNE